jgi:hypothetical protein
VWLVWMAQGTGHNLDEQIRTWNGGNDDAGTQ